MNLVRRSKSGGSPEFNMRYRNLYSSNLERQRIILRHLPSSSTTQSQIPAHCAVRRRGSAAAAKTHAKKVRQSDGYVARLNNHLSRKVSALPSHSQPPIQAGCSFHAHTKSIKQKSNKPIRSTLHFSESGAAFCVTFLALPMAQRWLSAAVFRTDCIRSQYACAWDTSEYSASTQVRQVARKSLPFARSAAA